MQNRQKRRYICGSILIALLANGITLAGDRMNLPVTIVVNSDGSGQAHGSIGDAYNSADSVQLIVCWAANDIGMCSMKNIVGLYKGCTTTDPAQLSVIRALTSDSAMYMNWDANGRCTVLSTDTGSSYHPKKP